MREANLSKECLALLVIFGYHRDHENFDKEKHKVLVYDCIDEIERTARTGRNALGLVLGVIRKIREHRCLDANMFEEPEETVNPCNEN